jgi:hypothetical protein
MLTKEQVAFFNTFGFLVRRQLFSPEEMAVIDRDFEDVMAEDRAGEVFRGDQRHSVVACAEMRPALAGPDRRGPHLRGDRGRAQPRPDVAGVRRQLLRRRHRVALRWYCHGHGPNQSGVLPGPGHPG